MISTVIHIIVYTEPVFRGSLSGGDVLHYQVRTKVAPRQVGMNVKDRIKNINVMFYLKTIRDCEIFLERIWEEGWWRVLYSFVPLLSILLYQNYVGHSY